MALEAVDGVFSAMRADPMEMTVWMAVMVAAGFLVCSLGLQGGLERVTKWMMLGLLVTFGVAAFGYATDLRSRTQGRGQYSMEPHSYLEIPKSIREKIIDQRMGGRAMR